MTSLRQLLHLDHAPVAIAFRAQAPANIPHVGAAGPSGCSYWKLASEGRVFHTRPGDHTNCPVGAYTHGVDMSEANAKELESLIGTMVGLGYLSMSEIPSIPKRDRPLEVVLYGPESDPAPFEPDVLLARGSARQMMILAEAAHAAGVGADGRMMMRPTCSILPHTMSAGLGATSFGCVGNRVYTELTDGEIYFAIPGGKIGAVADKLRTMTRANAELEKFHQARRLRVLS